MAGPRPQARWHIAMLGQFQLSWGGAIRRPLQRQKSTTLLAYLAYHPRFPHPREVLIELLWPEEDPEVSRPKLRSLLHELRELLAVTYRAADPLLRADRTTVSLDPDSFTTDVAEFRDAVHAASAATETGEQIPRLEMASERYRGELLPGFFEPWVLSEREHLAYTYLETLRRLAQAREALGDLDGAVAAAQQAIRVEPLREDAHLDLMRLYAANGQPAASLRQYQALERLLREGLDAEPSAEARSLSEELRRADRAVAVGRHAPGRRPTNDERPTTSDSVAPHSSRPRALASSRPSSLVVPAQLTLFFGREEEIAQLTELLSSSTTRLVTVTGPGGTGKTRLAIAVLGRLKDWWGGGITYVSLADLTDPARVTDAIADALGIVRSPDVELFEQVIEAVAAGPWVLVLDNYEHLIAGESSSACDGALHVWTLLERVPTLTCLVTSRRRLGLAGEREYALSPLPTPRRGAGLDELRNCASVQLFVDRARATRSAFRLTEENAAVVGELCDRLEGLPLALELAALRAAARSPGEMLALLDRRFEFLVSRQRDVPARHRTLRATIESSYQLLDPGLRQFLMGLSVFRGGWTLEAAAAVCLSSEAALESMELLLEYSLIQSEERRGETRYRMLETLREYGWEQLSSRGELAAARARHRDWFLQVAEQAEPELSGPLLSQWLERLEAEHDNLRAALSWSGENRDGETELRLAGSLAPFWDVHGHWSEGRAWLAALLDGGAGQTRVRAKALSGAGMLASRLSDHAAARAWHEESLAIHQERGDRQGIRSCLTALGNVAWNQADPVSARDFHQQSLAIARDLDDKRGIAATLRALGSMARFEGEDHSQTRLLLEESLTTWKEIGDEGGIAEALLELGLLAHEEQRSAAARSLCQESLAIYRDLQNKRGIAHCLATLGALARAAGDYPAAQVLLEESLTIQREMGDRHGVGYSLRQLGHLANACGDLATARKRSEESLAIWREIGSKLEAIHQLGNLGHLSRKEGDYSRALSFYKASLVERVKLGDHLVIALSLEDIAVVVARQGQHREAVRLFGAAAALCEPLGRTLPVAVAEEYELAVGITRSALGDDEFAAAWARGRAMSLEQSVTFALEETA